MKMAVCAVLSLLAACYAGTQPCTAEMPRGPTIGSVILIAGCSGLSSRFAEAELR